MPQPTVLVTGATGKTGNAVALQLMERGVPVRAVVHRSDQRSEALRRRGADVRVADMFDPDQLHDAMRGVRRAYYLTLFRPYMTQAAAAFAVAARDANLEAVVQLGQYLSHRAHPAVMTRETWLVDRLFSMIPGTAHVIINPGMFADNFLRVIDFASLLHLYPILTGESRSAPVSNEDIARVAVAVLMDPLRHAGKSYRPSGPTLLSGREMAAVIARVVGHRVVPVDVPFWMFSKVARMTGASIHEVYCYRQYVREHRLGTFALDGGVTDVVSALTGKPAEDFATIAKRYADLPFAKQSLTNRLKAFARLNLTPFYPGHDLDNYEREMRFPAPTNPSFSFDDARWRDEHLAQSGVATPQTALPASPRDAHERLRAGNANRAGDSRPHPLNAAAT